MTARPRAALTAAQGVARRMAVAAPEAWRCDRVFRWAGIGAGATLALLALRLAGPPRQESLPAASMTYVGPGASLPAAFSPAPPAAVPDVPRIAPGHALDGVAVAPAPQQGDRFGVVHPAARPEP